MTKRSKIIIFFVIALVCLLPVLFFLSLSLLPELLSSPPAPVVGIILDQNGEPLSDVVIVYEEESRKASSYVTPFHSFSLKRKGSVKSDRDGCFKFSRRYTFIKYISISKSGYICEYLRPKYVNEPSGVTNIIFYLYKIEPQKKDDLISGESDWFPLKNNASVYYDVEGESFSEKQETVSDLELYISEDIVMNTDWQPFVIRSLGKGVFFCKNNMPYAPINNYESGVLINTNRCYPKYEIPFFSKSSQNNYSRIWLKLDGNKNKKVKIKYTYNCKGDRYLGIDTIYDKVNVYANIPHASPVHTDWWGYMDSRMFFLIVSEERIIELYNSKKSIMERELAWQFAINPITPKWILAELAMRNDTSQVLKHLSRNPLIDPMEVKIWAGLDEKSKKNIKKNQGRYKNRNKQLLRVIKKFQGKIENGGKTIKSTYDLYHRY